MTFAHLKIHVEKMKEIVILMKIARMVFCVDQTIVQLHLGLTLKWIVVTQRMEQIFCVTTVMNVKQAYDVVVGSQMDAQHMLDCWHLITNVVLSAKFELIVAGSRVCQLGATNLGKIRKVNTFSS